MEQGDLAPIQRVVDGFPEPERLAYTYRLRTVVNRLEAKKAVRRTEEDWQRAHLRGSHLARFGATPDDRRVGVMVRRQAAADYDALDRVGKADSGGDP